MNSRVENNKRSNRGEYLGTVRDEARTLYGRKMLSKGMITEDYGSGMNNKSSSVYV